MIRVESDGMQQRAQVGVSKFRIIASVIEGYVFYSFTNPSSQQHVILSRANRKPSRVALPRGCARHGALQLFPHPQMAH
jgi:hypothetical protein